MSIEMTLFAHTLYIEPPQGWLGWLGWLALFGGVLALFFKWQAYNKQFKAVQWGILAALIILLPLTSLFVVIRLPAGQALPPPGMPVDSGGAAFVVLAALPWVLAAGFLGPAPATILAGLAGIPLTLWETHSLFTPLEMALLGLLFGAAMQQRYRTTLFAALRQPLVVAAALALVYPLLYTVDGLLITSGNMASRMDYVITHLQGTTLARGGELLLAGLVAQIVAFAFPRLWGGRGPLQAAPMQRRLYTRFLFSMLPIALLLVVALVVGDWIVAGKAAQQMLQDRMAGTARVVAEAVPFFLESGQNLIQQLARDPRLTEADPQLIEQALQENLRTIPFFRQLFYLDAEGQAVAGYPESDFARIAPTADEFVGIELALNGVGVQYYTLPPLPGDKAAQVSFMAVVLDESGQIDGVLLGRTDLLSNPFTQPILSSLSTMAGADGEGMLLDNEGRILYHTVGLRTMEKYIVPTSNGPAFYDETSPNGTRNYVYYQPSVGHPWGVILTVPARRGQQIALDIAIPLLAVVLVVTLITAIVLRVSLQAVTASLENLALEANRIAGGQLNHPLLLIGDDEVGQLRRAFERMRASLKDRLDELNRLLQVSQGVASSLEIRQAVQPLLDSALAMGACAVRLALDPVVVPEVSGDAFGPVRFGAGAAAEAYAQLDDQVLELVRQQDRVVLYNFARLRTLNIPTGVPRPEALLAMALRHENTFYGVLWLVYDTPHQFSDDEMRFMTTLSGQAALAAANTGLFSNAEIGRQRLDAILTSTPDPVLVTDQQGRLLLANPAARLALDFGSASGIGLPIEQLVKQKELLRLLRPTSDDKLSAEVTLPDGHVYLSTSSAVMAENRRVGRVCVMRDITHFKQVDALKSEFVATVSHDLRSPLTLMRGYATMLEMVGNLNDQQLGYVRKIVTSVETMSRLVNNLLDLRRIEAGIGLQLEMVPLHDVVERVTSALQLQASQKHIQLTVEIPPQTIPLVEADHALLQQALHNLVENAIKYTEPEGQVAVRIQPRQDRMVFEVSDTGIGIAPVDLPRIFEKFYRAGQKEAQKQHGSGLGLAIVKSIAERHGGEAWVESQLGKGSTFYFAIPFRQPKADEKKPH